MEDQPVKSMSEVMLEHFFHWRGQCSCGVQLKTMNPVAIAQHVEEALRAAGYMHRQEALHEVVTHARDAVRLRVEVRRKNDQL